MEDPLIRREHYEETSLRDVSIIILNTFKYKEDKKYRTIEEICQETGLERDSVSSFILSNPKKIIKSKMSEAFGQDTYMLNNVMNRISDEWNLILYGRADLRS